MVAVLEATTSDPTVGTVHGLSTDGEAITLQKCRREKSTGNITRGRSFRTERFSTETVLVGEFLPADQGYWKLSTSIQNLVTWINILSVETPGNPDRPLGPARTEEALLDGAEVVLAIWEDVQSDLPAKPANVFPDEPVEIETMLNHYLRSIQSFVTLAVGDPPFPQGVTVYPEQYGHERSRVRLYQRVPFYSPSDEVSWNDMNFTLQDIDLTSAIENWFDSVDLCEDIHNKYFAQIYNSDMYLDNQFLAIVVGLEHYHRETYPSGTYMQSEEWLRERDAIVDSLPDIPARKRVKDLIQSIGNKYSLGDRLREIRDDHDDVLSATFDDVDSVISDLTGARIDLAHGLDREGMDHEELYRRTKWVEAFATAYFLNVVEVSDEQAVEILQNNITYYSFS